MKEVKKFEFKTVSRESKYPWAKILDGKTYELTKGTDYDCNTRNMGGKIRIAARKFYKTVKVSVNEKDDKIVLQATAMTDEQRKAEDARRIEEKAEAKQAKADKKNTTATPTVPASAPEAPAATPLQGGETIG